MKNGILINQTQDEVMARQTRLCQGLWDRMRGLLGTKTLAEDEACWLIPCNSVHTVGMQYPIDVYFLNKKNEIVSVMKNMQPNRISPIVWKAHSTLEFISGPKRNLNVGDELTWRENEEKGAQHFFGPGQKSVAPPFSRNSEKTGTGTKKGDRALFRTGPGKGPVPFFMSPFSKGQSMVEFPMTLVVFIIIVLCMTDALSLTYGWLALQYATNRGIRVVKMAPTGTVTTGGIQGEVAAAAAALGLNLTGVNVVPFGARTIRVNTTADVTLPVWGLLTSFAGDHSGTYTLRASEVVRNAPL